MGRRLYVGNLPYDASEAAVEELFAGAGSVREVHLVRDKMTGQARGFGFVEMNSESEAQAAISQLNEQAFGGRTLTVNEARPQAPVSGGGGGAPRSRREPRW